MGFWSTLGKVGLTVAPYVAAPFTGGASLLAIPAANKAVSAWNQSDANKAIAQGQQPSSFDKYLSMAGGIAGMAGGAGAFGGLGDAYSAGNFTGVGPSAGAFQKAMGAVNTGMASLGAAQGAPSAPSVGSASGIGPSGSVKSPYGMTMNPNYTSPNYDPTNMNQNMPNLAQSILAGRRNSIVNQPFRGGYAVNTWRRNPQTGMVEPVQNWMPPIQSDFQ